MAAAQVRTSYSRAPISPPPAPRRFDVQNDPNDLVRQMRRAATRQPSTLVETALIVGGLLLVNPAGLFLTWRSGTLAQMTKVIVSAVSVLWYLGVAGLTFALLHHR
jgi:hypothetical protein